MLVGRSVRRSVYPSVRPSEITLLFQVFRAERRSDLSYCPCPTNILPLPTRTRLKLPCIQPFLKWEKITLKVHGAPQARERMPWNCVHPCWQLMNFYGSKQWKLIMKRLQKKEIKKVPGAFWKEQVCSNKDESKVRMFKRIVLNCLKLFLIFF